MDHRAGTRAAYDEHGARWTARKQAQDLGFAQDLASVCDGPILDVGCGPGWHLNALGAAAVGIDLSMTMLQQAPAGATLAQCDLSLLPWRRGSFAGAWASRTLVHLPRSEVPLALSELHRVISDGGYLAAVLFTGDSESAQWPDDPFPGRTFSYWQPEHLRQVVESAGFEIERFDASDVSNRAGRIRVLARRVPTLPDFVGPDMNLLVCGLNPSPSSADSGVGFFKAGNRFWPAALQAGLASVDRDPRHALLHHGLGMTDLVKRPTRRADELSKDEYIAGLDRLRALATWLKPKAICMVGLAGWRAAVDRKAERGWQAELIGGCPVYVMSSTSGLNAHDTIASLTAHLSATQSPPPKR